MFSSFSERENTAVVYYRFFLIKVSIIIKQWNKHKTAIATLGSPRSLCPEGKDDKPPMMHHLVSTNKNQTPLRTQSF